MGRSSTGGGKFDAGGLECEPLGTAFDYGIGKKRSWSSTKDMKATLKKHLQHHGACNCSGKYHSSYVMRMRE